MVSMDIKLLGFIMDHKVLCCALNSNPPQTVWLWISSFGWYKLTTIVLNWWTAAAHLIITVIQTHEFVNENTTKLLNEFQLNISRNENHT